jgi:hypothetical protein
MESTDFCSNQAMIDSKRNFDYLVVILWVRDPRFCLRSLPSFHVASLLPVRILGATGAPPREDTNSLAAEKLAQDLLDFLKAATGGLWTQRQSSEREERTQRPVFVGRKADLPFGKILTGSRPETGLFWILQ